MNTQNYWFKWCNLLLLGACLFCHAGISQSPFLRTGQVYVILQNTNELQVFSVLPSYNSINTVTVGNLPAGGLDAIGFRRSDNFLYGIGAATNHLFKIGENAVFQDLGDVGLDPALFYQAGDLSPDGQYFYAVGSNASGMDMHLAKIDLLTPGYPIEYVTLSGVDHLQDLALDPTNGVMYGYDKTNGWMVRINPATGVATALTALEPGNTLYGIYFDAFGDMYGVGSTLYGIVDGYYQLDKITGKENRLATGPSSTIADMASCPFSVEIKNEVYPVTNLPCTEITYTFTLANGSGEAISGLEFLHPVPAGFHFAGVLQNTFGGFVDTMSVPGNLRMQNLNLSPGTRTLKVKMAVDDIPKGKYNTQTLIKNLPPLYGTISRSDQPSEAGFEDSTAFFVTRFDKDTLDFAWLICTGDNLVLETKAYGDNILWDSGSMVKDLTVSETGIYRFIAGSTCEKVVVRHEVTSATCPFTISVANIFAPDTSFACSDVIFRYILNNDSGEPRYNLGISDTLPADFNFVEVLKNPFGGTVKPGLSPNVFCLQGMTLKEGIDTLDIRVHVGDVPPRSYKNRAVLFGLPVLMGPIRLSDNPYTFAFDSSILYIQGALYDSLFYEKTLCENAEITLDASALGKTFLWDDGATSPVKVVTDPGNYHLILFDGCEPADIYWNVLQGPKLQIELLESYAIHQGESIQLSPQILNEGHSLSVTWSGPLADVLSCWNCASPIASPLETAVFGFKAENEACFDSVAVEVEVDQTRRIYAPNVFSPNDDGQNDTFYLQSPDFGQVIVLNIYDRWGNLLFQSKDFPLAAETLHWDGNSVYKPMPAGVYLWWANIEFVDGRRQVFTGDVTIVR